MDKLICIETFIKSVNCGSLRKAAAELHQTEASISKRISRLEADLDVILMERSRTGLKLTEIGERYYEMCTQGIESIKLADQYIKSQKVEPSGKLKVVCNSFFSKHYVTPKLKSFLKKYPRIRLQIEILELFPDFSEHDMDILFGVGLTLPSKSEIVQKHLMQTQEVLCATPTYLKKFNIQKPADLIHLDYIAHSHRRPVNKIFLDKDAEILITPTLLCNNAQASIDAALKSIGFIYIKKYFVQEYLNSGRLMQILAKYTKSEIPIYAYYNYQAYPDSKIIAFLSHFAKNS